MTTFHYSKTIAGLRADGACRLCSRRLASCECYNDKAWVEKAALCGFGLGHRSVDTTDFPAGLALDEAHASHLEFYSRDERGQYRPGHARLSGASLRGAVLRYAVLAKANLSGANLSGATLQGAKLQGANLTGANLEGANLEGVNLTGANLGSANIAGANLAGAKADAGTIWPEDTDREELLRLLDFGEYISMNLDGMTVTQSTWTKPTFSPIMALIGSDGVVGGFRGASLKGARFLGAFKIKVELSDLTGADLAGADLRGCAVTGCNLTGADLRGADLRGVRMTRVDLSGADLQSAILDGADLCGVDLRTAQVDPGALDGAKLRHEAVYTTTQSGCAYFRPAAFTPTLRPGHAGPIPQACDYELSEHHAVDLTA
jgi:uncharacterized protein YjbI with pentapeptide repeats